MQCSVTIWVRDRWSQPVCSFRSAKAAALLEFLVPLTNCFVCRWFCAILRPKPPLHRLNWLSFGKFQDTERFLIPCPRHVSSWVLHSGETCKYTMAPITQTNLERFSIYWYAPFCCVLVVALPSSEFPERLMNFPIYTRITVRLILKTIIDEGWKHKEKWRYKGLRKYIE
jgi:hypothetical protein